MLLHGNDLLRSLCRHLLEHARCCADAGQYDDRPRFDGRPHDWPHQVRRSCPSIELSCHNLVTSCLSIQIRHEVLKEMAVLMFADGSVLAAGTTSPAGSARRCSCRWLQRAACRRPWPTSSSRCALSPTHARCSKHPRPLGRIPDRRDPLTCLAPRRAQIGTRR